METTAAMRKMEKQINGFRAKFAGRAVLYTLPSGAIVYGEISDMAYNAEQDGFPAYWDVRVKYISNGMEFNSWTSPNVLQPVGWTA